MNNMAICFLILPATSVLYGATISSEADLRTAIEQGTGTHALALDLKLSANLPDLPAASSFSLNGQNHSISGEGKYSLFKCPNRSTVLVLENLTLKNAHTEEHGAAVSSGQGLIEQRAIPLYGIVPIMNQGSQPNRVLIRNCIIRDNVSAKSGGAIFVHLEGDPDQAYGPVLDYLHIENSAIIHNTVLKGPSIVTFQVNGEYNNGGGIWVRVQSSKYDVVITNTTLSDNEAPELGGAILVGESAGGDKEEMPIRLHNCTVVNNNCGLAGGAFWHDHALLLDHSIVFNNSVGGKINVNGSDIAGPGPDLTIRWSDLGNRHDEHGVDIDKRCQYPVRGYSALWENNNLSVDPKLTPLPIFIQAQNGTAYDSWVYQLDKTSPVINAGDPSLVMGQGSTSFFDQRGNPKKRVELGRIDLGSFEYADVPVPVENTPPSLGKLDNIRLWEDSSIQITFTVSDRETQADQLQVTIDRNENPQIYFSQVSVNGETRTVTVRPNPDFNTSLAGPQSVTVLVQDAMGAVAKQSFTFEVDEINDKPFLVRSYPDTLSARTGIALVQDLGFAGRINRGDETTAKLEQTQKVRFNLFDVDRTDFFQSLIIDSLDGVIRFTAKDGLSENQSSRVRFYLKDDGGIKNKGRDTSDLYEFYVKIAFSPIISKPPYADPPHKTFTTMDPEFKVTLIPGEAGSTIFYTLNGSTPDTVEGGASNTFKYTGPISVDAALVIKAVAIKSGQVVSPVMLATYDEILASKVATPIATPPGPSIPGPLRFIQGPLWVLLSDSTQGAIIQVILDDAPAIPYSSALSISKSTVIKAYAVKWGWVPSDTLVVQYLYVPRISVVKAYYQDVDEDGRIETVRIEFDKALSVLPEILSFKILDLVGNTHERTCALTEIERALNSETQVVVTLKDPFPAGVTSLSNSVNSGRLYSQGNLPISDKTFPVQDSVPPVIIAGRIFEPDSLSTFKRIRITLSEPVFFELKSQALFSFKHGSEEMVFSDIKIQRIEQVGDRDIDLFIDTTSNRFPVAGDSVSISSTGDIVDMAKNFPSQKHFHYLDGIVPKPKPLEIFVTFPNSTRDRASDGIGSGSKVLFIPVDKSGNAIIGNNRDGMCEGLCFTGENGKFNGPVIHIVTPGAMKFAFKIFNNFGQFVAEGSGRFTNMDLKQMQRNNTSKGISYIARVVWNGKTSQHGTAGTGAYILQAILILEKDAATGAPATTTTKRIIFGVLRAPIGP